MKKIKYLACILSVFVSQTAMSQDSPTHYQDFVPQFQDNSSDPYNVPTPDQSNLGTYGIIPISPYTGKADISIPIYSTAQRDVKLDIMLTYDTSGLLINQLPGWTGHGWTLQAGGAITRIINNRPDEISYVGTNAGRDVFLQYLINDISFMTDGEYISEDQMSPDELMIYQENIADLLFNELPEVSRYENYANYFTSASNLLTNSTILAPNKYDSAADIFNFNFMGISGSFFYGNDGNWKVRCDRNIQVLFDVSDSTNYIKSYREYYWYGPNCPIETAIVKQPKTIKGFTLIDEQGNKYIFGGDKDFIEYSTSLMGQVVINTTEPWNAVSWMLKEVQDRFGNTLYRFSYSRGNEIVQIQNSYNVDSLKAKSPNCVPGEHAIGKVYSGTINAPVYLDSISIQDGTKIVFNHTNIYTNNAYKKLYPNFSLDSFDAMEKNVYPRLTGQNENPNDIKFDQYVEKFKYFFYINGESAMFDPLQHMTLEKLKEIRIFGPETSTIDYKVFAFVYSFTTRMHLNNLVCAYGPSYSNAYTYDFRYDRYNTLPSDYLTKQFDIWGYYNGIDYDSVSGTNVWTADDDYLTRITKSERVPGIPDITCGTIGMLTKITYPTGGYSTIEYEQNNCSKYISDDKQSVIEMQNDIPVGGLRVKTISHYDGNVLVGRKNYSYKKTNSQRSSGELNKLPKFIYEWEDNKYKYKMRCYNSVIPLANSLSPSVGYSEVSEIELDGSKTTYTYTNFSSERDQLFDDSRFGLDIFTPFDEFSSRQYMCGLPLKEIRFDANSDSIHSVTYKYISDESFNENNYVKTTNFTMHQLYAKVGSVFKMFYFRPGTERVVTRTKQGNAWITDIKSYNRPHTLLPVTNPQNHTDSVDIWNIESETIQRGNDQIRTEYTYPYTDTGINTQLVNQFCLPVTGVRHYLNNVLTDGTRTIYKQAGNIVPAYDLAFASNPTKCDTIAKYLAYTPTYKVSKLVDSNGIQHHYYWNDRDQLIASAANGSINIANSNADINTIIANNQSNIFAGTPTDAKLYAYNNKGLPTKIVGTNGMSASFEYDNMGRLTKIKDTNGSTTNKYTYNYGKSISSTINELSTCSLYASITGSNLIINYKIPYSAESAEIRITRTGTSITSNSHTLPTNVTEGAFGVFFNSGTSHVQICLYVNGILRETVEKDMN